MDIKSRRFPEGTVVKVSHSDMKMMIVGLSQIDQTTGELYDYCAVPFPHGYINGDNMLLFNDDKIEEVYHMGYLDDDVYDHLAYDHVLAEELRKK